MGIKISTGMADTTVIDIEGEPFPWLKLNVILLTVLAATSATSFLAAKLLPQFDSDIIWAIGGIAAIVFGASAGQKRTKKITLTPQRIDVVKGSATNTVTIPVGEITNCIVTKNLGGGGRYKFVSKNGGKISIEATGDLFPALKPELQKRYKFPVS